MKTTHPQVDYASEVDRVWFERHPGVDHYTRRCIVDEFAPMRPGRPCLYVRVEQVFPGFRIRTPASSPRICGLDK